MATRAAGDETAGNGGTSSGGAGAASDVPGIWTFVPQWGHLPLCPAVSSGVRINFPQPGQWNSIGMDDSGIGHGNPHDQRTSSKIMITRKNVRRNSLLVGVPTLTASRPVCRSRQGARSTIRTGCGRPRLSNPRSVSSLLPFCALGLA